MEPEEFLAQKKLEDPTVKPKSPIVGGSIKRICSNCQYAHKFTPRQDEIERGLLLGCKYPGWEGYVKDDDAKNCHTFVEQNEATYDDVELLQREMILVDSISMEDLKKTIMAAIVKELEAEEPNIPYLDGLNRLLGTILNFT